MQYLKDEVRQRILLAASEEFFTEGYANASIRVIAKNAGISSGNVYRYFSSKALIFDEVVGNVYHVFKAQLQAISLEKEKLTNTSPEASHAYIQQLDSTLLKLFEQSRKEMSILLFKSQGSSYEHIRHDLHHLAAQSIQNAFPFDKLNFSQGNRQLWAESVATGLIESICYLLAHSDDTTPVAGLLTEYLKMYACGMHAYFNSKK